MIAWFNDMIEETKELVTVSDVAVRIVDEKKPDPSNQYCMLTNYKTDDGLVKVAYITGPIGDLRHYVPLLTAIESMESNDKLIIYLDSGGGFVSTGSAIASALVSSQGTSVGVARGLCCSSASYIWSACTYQVAEPLAVLMYHMSSHMDRGNSEDIRRRAEQLVKFISNGPLKLAVEKGHLLPSEVEEIQKGRTDVYITAKEMNKRLKNRRS